MGNKRIGCMSNVFDHLAEGLRQCAKLNFYLNKNTDRSWSEGRCLRLDRKTKRVSKGESIPACIANVIRKHTNPGAVIS